jgi:uridine kinase
MVSTYSARAEVRRMRKEASHITSFLDQLDEISRGQLLAVETYSHETYNRAKKHTHIGRAGTILVNCNGPSLRLNDYVHINIFGGELSKEYEYYFVPIAEILKIVSDRERIKEILHKHGRSLAEYRKIVSDYSPPLAEQHFSNPSRSTKKSR